MQKSFRKKKTILFLLPKREKKKTEKKRRGKIEYRLDRGKCTGAGGRGESCILGIADPVTVTRLKKKKLKSPTANQGKLKKTE